MLKGRLIETRVNVCFYKERTDINSTSSCSSDHLDFPFHLERDICGQRTSKKTTIRTALGHVQSEEDTKVEGYECRIPRIQWSCCNGKRQLSYHQIMLHRRIHHLNSSSSQRGYIRVAHQNEK